MGRSLGVGALRAVRGACACDARVGPANTPDPAPLHVAFLEAAASLGLPFLDDADDPVRPTGAARLPVNVVDDTRWNTAFAYLDPARGRAETSRFSRTRLSTASRWMALGPPARSRRLGERIDADVVVLTAGAYFTPAILLRSGIGPESELARHEIPVVATLPVGEVLLDHHGSGINWQSNELLDRVTADHVRRTGAAVRASRDREGREQRVRRGEAGTSTWFRGRTQRTGATGTRQASGSST